MIAGAEVGTPRISQQFGGAGLVLRDGAGDELGKLLSILRNLRLEIGDASRMGLVRGLLAGKRLREGQEMVASVGEHPFAFSRLGVDLGLAVHLLLIVYFRWRGALNPSHGQYRKIQSVTWRPLKASFSDRVQSFNPDSPDHATADRPSGRSDAAMPRRRTPKFPVPPKSFIANGRGISAV